MLREKFEEVFEHYQSDREKFETLPPPRTLADLRSAQILTRILPDEFQMACGLGAHYRFEGSVGKGNIAEIPHLCLFDTDITTTAQEGHYIVYLFDSDFSTVHLSLNQGWTQYENRYGIPEGRRKIETKATFIQDILEYPPPGFTFDRISLGTNRDLGVGYEKGNICSKAYLKGKMPADENLISDIKALVHVYSQVSQKIDLLAIVDRETEMEFQESVQRAKPKALPPGPIEIPKRSHLSEREIWRRDPSMAAIALKNADHQCEADSRHETFLVSTFNHPFMEGHHLIPLQFQDKFEYSLDVPENILSLCPNCHRAMHHGKTDFRRPLLKRFYKERIQGLLSRELALSLKDLIGYYQSALSDEYQDGE